MISEHVILTPHPTIISCYILTWYPNQVVQFFSMTTGGQWRLYCRFQVYSCLAPTYWGTMAGRSPYCLYFVLFYLVYQSVKCQYNTKTTSVTKNKLSVKMIVDLTLEIYQSVIPLATFQIILGKLKDLHSLTLSLVLETTTRPFSESIHEWKECPVKVFISVLGTSHHLPFHPISAHSWAAHIKIPGIPAPQQTPTCVHTEHPRWQGLLLFFSFSSGLRFTKQTRMLSTVSVNICYCESW